MRFEEHANSKCHGEAVERLFTLPKVLKDVGKSLSKQHSEQKKAINFLNTLRNLRFLAQQNIPIKGETENIFNVYEVIKLQTENDADLQSVFLN